ncbi:AAA family ATPase [Nocardia sp. 2]|uniref:AAA family ATPase n=1 Tax=Nocardia acididurans TaxID=2802282 RepID=A0ABS1ML02_9NOCA|nr:LuxR family transcriptional regulator [Nocardia acididurans]MBL1079943.1 AAA family ATPase [Nocardia acididurans]
MTLLDDDALVLYGRDAEMATLGRLLDGARVGRGAALVVHGAPGLGKTALLGEISRRATDFKVLSGHGGTDEAQVPFAALHELLWPLAGRIPGLPHTAAAALHGLLRLGPPAGDRLALSTAVLLLLTELAAVQPVLVLIDDADRLDRESAACLAAVGRRSGEAGVVMVFSTRRDPATCGLGAFPRLTLRELEEHQARELAADRQPGLTVPERRRLLRMARGNPLALTESLTVDQRSGAGPFAGSEWWGDPHPAGPALRTAYAAVLEGLSTGARTVLLLIAAAGHSEVGVVRSAAFASGVTEPDWREALESETVLLADGRIRLRHPMNRAVVYHSAPAAARRAAHGALAEAMTATGERAGRGRQLAAATPGPDEALAIELTSAAADLVRDDHRLVAADLLYRAALLSPDAGRAAGRLARAARAAFAGGDIEAARELLDRAERGGGRELAARASDGLSGLLALGRGDLDGVHEDLGRDLVVVDADAEAELRFTADRAGWVAGRTWDPGAAFTVGEVEPWRLPPWPLAVATSRAAPALDSYRAAARAARERGEQAWEALMLAQSAGVRLALGQWADATADARAALELAEPNGYTNSAVQSLNTLALHAALTGAAETAEQLCERAQELSGTLRTPILAAGTWTALGVAALSAGEPELALTRLSRLIDPEHEAGHPTFAALAALEAIEAAVRLGRPDTATDFLTVLRDWAADTDASWAIAAAACGRALLSDDSVAERHFRAALTASGHSERPFQHARIQLLYGEWLRRTRRRSVAREQLEPAAATFERLGAHPWARRARQECDLVDARSTLRLGAEHEELLTPQEARVARLATTGATNREIAARLSISHRTVGHHLSRVFAKLGVRCRAELAGSGHLRD